MQWCSLYLYLWMECNEAQKTSGQNHFFKSIWSTFIPQPCLSILSDQTLTWYSIKKYFRKFVWQHACSSPMENKFQLAYIIQCVFSWNNSAYCVHLRRVEESHATIYVYVQYVFTKCKGKKKDQIDRVMKHINIFISCTFLSPM